MGHFLFTLAENTTSRIFPAVFSFTWLSLERKTLSELTFLDFGNITTPFPDFVLQNRKSAFFSAN